MSSGWAKALAAAKTMELEQRQWQDKKDLSDREFVDKHAESMWDEVRSIVIAAANDLNREMGRSLLTFPEGMGGDDVIGKFYFKLQSAKSHTEVRFDSNSNTLHCAEGSYRLSVVAGNGLIWMSAHHGITSESLAHLIVQEVFKSV